MHKCASCARRDNGHQASNSLETRRAVSSEAALCWGFPGICAHAELRSADLAVRTSDVAGWRIQRSPPHHPRHADSPPRSLHDRMSRFGKLSTRVTWPITAGAYRQHAGPESASVAAFGSQAGLCRATQGSPASGPASHLQAEALQHLGALHTEMTTSWCAGSGKRASTRTTSCWSSVHAFTYSGHCTISSQKPP